MSATATLVLAQMYGGGHMDRDRVIWWIPIIWLVCVALLALAIVAILRLWQAGQSSQSGTAERQPAATSRARTILAERYARGEITTEEFRERNAALDGPERETP